MDVEFDNALHLQPHIPLFTSPFNSLNAFSVSLTNSKPLSRLRCHCFDTVVAVHISLVVRQGWMVNRRDIRLGRGYTRIQSRWNGACFPYEVAWTGGEVVSADQSPAEP